MLESILDCKELITLYNWRLVEDPKENPLFLATELVHDKLLKCPDAVTNQSQIIPLLAYSKYPFIALTRVCHKPALMISKSSLNPPVMKRIKVDNGTRNKARNEDRDELMQPKSKKRAC